MSEPAGERAAAIERLIAELRRQGIVDERVLAAIRNVPRERFVPASQQSEAWTNNALPIGAGQTISQPYVVAAMTAALVLTGTERVLEVGTGSGYQAAILAELARFVVTIERHALLARGAEALLRELGYRNIEVRIGDGSRGAPELAPFDRIIVTAAAPAAPETLLAQLNQDGGRMVIPLGTLRDQELVAIERRGATVTEERFGPVRFVPLIGEDAWPPARENGHGRLRKP